MNTEASQIAAYIGIDPADIQSHADHYLEHGGSGLDSIARDMWLPSDPKRQLYRRLVRLVAEETKETKP